MAEETKKEETKKEETKKEVPEETKAVEVPAEEVKEEATAEKPKVEKIEKPKVEEKKEKKIEPEVKSEPEEEVEVPEKFQKLVGSIESLSVLDLAELVKLLEKKFGVSAAAPVIAVAASGDGNEPQAEEKKSYNIELTGVGDKKIEVIKAVRDITQKGLKDSKDLVDAAASAPQLIKENVKKEEAEEIKKKFEAAGAKVELK